MLLFCFGAAENDVFQLWQTQLNILSQCQLTASALQVVFTVFNTVIWITLQIVRQEADSLLCGESEKAVGKSIQLGFAEGSRQYSKEAFAESTEHIHVDFDFVQVGAVFCFGIGAGAQSIAKVVSNESRHDGIQVDDTESFAFVVEKDIVDFGIVVADTKRKLAFVEQVSEETGFFFHGKESIVFCSAGSKTVDGIGSSGSFQCSITASGIVEVDDGFVEIIGWEVRQLLLELTESQAGFTNDVQIFHGAVGKRWDEVADSPEAAVVLIEILTLRSGEEVKQSALRCLYRKVSADSCDVFHDLLRLWENIGVQSLKQIILCPIRTGKGHFIGLIDVADGDFFHSKKLTVREERMANMRKVFHDRHSFDVSYCIYYSGKRREAQGANIEAAMKICYSESILWKMVGEQMDSVNKTLYIPLYGKAYVSRKGLFLQDKKAEEIWEKEGFPLKGKAKSKWLAYYMGIRSAVFDRWLKEQLAAHPDAAVLHLGCGMDSRVLRVSAEQHSWYDVDFPEVICERKRYFSERENYRMLSGDVRSSGWLTEIPEKKQVIVVMEGISMYLSLEELKGLLAALREHFEHVTVLMDCYSELAAKLSKYKNPINEVGVTKVYGLDEPKHWEGEGFVFVGEACMTPQELVEQLQGMERRIFQKLYAGRFSKGLYRLYEYKTQRNP